MAEVLKDLPPVSHPNLLVGFNSADDAGVFRINDYQALVQTVDFFPPIVDDPYHFGQIAAANAVSDIYAMGGTPLTALNIVGFPPKMAPEILTQILRGGSEKIAESGATLVGGHSIKDNELKYGVAVTGIIEIDKIISNAGARPGDILFLTKPLGTGIITTAIKQGKATAADVANVVARMAALNRSASELMVKHSAHAATDITGFGILGHGFEIADNSGVSLEIEFARLPIIPNAIKYAGMNLLTGGARANEEYLKGKIEISSKLSRAEIEILFDAQTSGGLLIALPPESRDGFTSDAGTFHLEIHEIGRVKEKQNKSLTII